MIQRQQFNELLRRVSRLEEEMAWQRKRELGALIVLLGAFIFFNLRKGGGLSVAGGFV